MDEHVAAAGFHFAVAVVVVTVVVHVVLVAEFAVSGYEEEAVFEVVPLSLAAIFAGCVEVLPDEFLDELAVLLARQVGS